MAVHEVQTGSELSAAIASIIAGPPSSDHVITLADGMDESDAFNGVQFADYVTVTAESHLGAKVGGLFDDAKFIRLLGLNSFRINSDRIERFIMDDCLVNSTGSTHCAIFNYGRFIEVLNTRLINARDDIIRIVRTQDVLIDRCVLNDNIPIDPTAHPDGIQIGDFGGPEGFRPERIRILRTLINDFLSTGAQRAQGVFAKCGGAKGIWCEDLAFRSGLSNGINLENTSTNEPFEDCGVVNCSGIGRNIVIEGLHIGTKVENNVAANVAFIDFTDGDPVNNPSTNINNFKHGFNYGDPGLAQLFTNPDGGDQWQDYVPIPGSPIENIGAIAYLDELEQGPPQMPDTIQTLNVDQALLDDDSDALAAGAIVDWDPARTPDPMIITPHDLDYVGDIRVFYTITDGEGLSDSAVVHATFNGSAPNANDDFVSGPKGQPIGLDPTLNDTAD